MDDFVDPSLRRSRVGWDELEVPASVRDMADDVWARLQRLAEPGGDEQHLHAALDGARSAYVSLYGDAEAIAQSSVTAAAAQGERPPARRRPPCLWPRAPPSGALPAAARRAATALLAPAEPL